MNSSNTYFPRGSCAESWAKSALLLVVFLLLTGDVLAGDWPQILGPHRNGVAVGEELTLPWPATGPKVEWSKEIGEGFAGPAIVGQRVVVFHRVEDKERVEAFDVATGRSLWQADFDAIYRGGINPDRGPRCVPLVHGDLVYAFGAAGDLYCVKLATGAKVWTREAYADYGGKEGYFGAGATPIVVGERLLVNVGGAKGAGIVAFDLATGRTAWQATNDAASYSSPAVLTIDGRPHALFITRLNALAIDPKDGTVRWSVPFGQLGPTVNAAAPLVQGDRVFLTASYGVGAKWLDVMPKSPRTVWANDETMSSQYNTPVFRDGYLYGIHGREDVGTAELRCVEVASGKVVWSETGFGTAHAILVGDKLLLARLSGEFVVASATPARYTALAKATLARDEMRAIPALAAGRLYFRDNQGGGGKLTCVRVGK